MGGVALAAKPSRMQGHRVRGAARRPEWSDRRCGRCRPRKPRLRRGGQIVQDRCGEGRQHEKKAAKLARERAIIDESVELSGGILEAAARYSPTTRESDELRLVRREHEDAVKKRERHAKRISTLSVKFHDDAFLRIAHCHYIMAPRGLLRPSQLPPYWGLLDESPAVVVEAPVKQIRDSTRHVLRAIARANTRDLMTACGQV